MLDLPPPLNFFFYMKSRPNLTTTKFCQWANEDLLMRITLEPGLTRKIGIETARKRMHELGFAIVQKKKGTFVDDHEQDDVVKYCNKFLRRMVSLPIMLQQKMQRNHCRLVWNVLIRVLWRKQWLSYIMNQGWRHRYGWSGLTGPLLRASPAHKVRQNLVTELFLGSGSCHTLSIGFDCELVKVATKR